jgi:hypothetical protein
VIFLAVHFHHFVKRKFEFFFGHKYFVVLKKVCPKKKFFFKKIAKSLHNYLQYERVLKIFPLSNFGNCQSWVNVFMDDHHFEQHPKIENKNRKLVHMQ